MRTSLTVLLPFVAALGVAGCGGTSSTPDDGGAPPARPSVGAQIDRMGRPTINVAVTDPFDITTAGRDATRDAYNHDSDESKWQQNWQADLQTMLAIYDGADAACGTQFLACGLPGGCVIGGACLADTDCPTDNSCDQKKCVPDKDAGGKNRYAMLSTVLADDRLYLDTRQSTCGLYLSVELQAVKAGLGANDCGGRIPTFDVVDLTYTAATVGAAGFMGNGTFAVTDGVAKDGDNGAVSLTTFPFLPGPN